MTSSSSTSRPIFDPVDTTFDPTDATNHSQPDDVESPSLSSSNALARFEFKPGKSKEGTKVLMVEWEDDATTKDIRGDWEVSWEGKRTVLPARETPLGAGGEEQPVNRLYFLLGPGVSIPTNVKLQKGNVVWRTNPLPAIFSPELGATATQAGKRGVLHTIWSKKRLQVLQQEIESESKENAEGIGLEMAMAEKEWIEQNFGVFARPGSISVPSAASAAGLEKGPASPRSPGGGRLMEKLRGLKVGTAQQDLQAASAGDSQSNNPLSPETSDVAVGGFGSFAAIKGTHPSQQQTTRQPPQQQARITAHNPPASITAQQRQQPQQATGMTSLNSNMDSLNSFANSNEPSFTLPSGSDATDADDKDDLFALPMSPRSPGKKAGGGSAFSFGAGDVRGYREGERA